MLLARPPAQSGGGLNFLVSKEGNKVAFINEAISRSLDLAMKASGWSVMDHRRQPVPNVEAGSSDE